MTIKTIDKIKCTGCKICIDACPMDVIRFDEETETAVIKYEKDCICCYNCEEDCPTGAIYVDPLRFYPIPPAF